ncbi:Smr/MutS family protein [Mucilaginibacter arboris]|uniref:DNA mismatch repair protein MutS n=1 Tax=Mucilaginibacter arboris TaxID=2682090 RepID=A0A7K1SRZ9_9SPHI|nr:Smr/MutS family protein [Mucilaginibacter arboris]MVN20083.1 DNA mismatch repair protein MutS [Mucilaginibacter arboris]
MKFKLGDFVRFVEEKREGFITRIIDGQTIGVTGEDDFEIPVLASKVTSVHGREAAVAAAKEQEEIEEAANQEFISKGIYLAAVPEKQVTSVVQFYLINQTSYTLLASFTTEKSQEFKGEFAGILLPRTAVKVFSAGLPDISIWPKFIFQILYHSKQTVDFLDPLIYTERFKAKDFAGSKTAVHLLNQQGWQFQLDIGAVKVDAQKLKESFFKSPEEKKMVEKPAKEIDLHIEKLRDDYQFLNSNEILKTQLERFQKTLDGAIVHQLPSIVFIHGVGNGILRHEIHKVVSKHPQVKTFMDARKEKFGYGATEVVLK